MATWGAACAPWVRGDEVQVRLRIAWGAGPQAPQTWSGAINVPGAELSAMRPLGIEADEAAALQLIENTVHVAPIVSRAFDGCDLSIRGDAAALVTVQLKNSTGPEAKEITVPLGELMTTPFQSRLDEVGGYLIIQRAPGDELRVRLDRDHLVFAPSEPFKLTVEPKPAHAGTEPLTLVTQLQSVADGRVLWETTAPVETAAPAAIEVEIPTPAAEGAYRVSLALRTHEGLASKLTIWQQHGPVASRDVEFVVIDPAARLPRLSGTWETVQTIDPANPKWWQRVPEWTQLDRLPVLTTPRSLGNVKPIARQSPTGRYVELAAPVAGAEASWQAYPLSTREVGQPYVVEIELPAGAPQQLAVSILETDAAGRVMSFGREAGVYVDERVDAGSAEAGRVERHRLVFWPRTASPLLLLANQSAEHAAAYGTIRVGRRETQPAASAAGVDGAANEDVPNRMVAAYVSLPRFSDCLGGAEQLDATSNLSVKGWSGFLEAINRLAQELRAGGYNAAVVSVAADGSSLAPIHALSMSPRYDTGTLSSRGADPLPKDVLEAMLRIFDREGLRVVPAIELATPLPELERLRRVGDPRETGVEYVALDGRTWDQTFPGKAAGAHYNVLNGDVQAAVGHVIDQLTERYGAHASLGGVAVQLSGRGYGVLPGLAWGLDDATMKRFATEAKSEVPAAGTARFQQRGQLVAGTLRSRWITWRQSELLAFYAELAERVRTGDQDRQLVLCTENLFAGSEANARLRQAVSGRPSIEEASEEIGIDFVALATAPGVCALRPRRLDSDEALQARAVDLLINATTEFEPLVPDVYQGGELHFYEARRLRLETFDAQSPFGADKTCIALSVASYPTGAAARRPLATALASYDALALVEGGELLPLTLDEETARGRRLFQELPGAEAEVRVEHRQPVTLRVYRTADATVVCLVNDSAWEVAVELPLNVPAATAWRDLGQAVDAATEVAAPKPPDVDDASGTLAIGAASWRLTLPAYGIAARRFATREVKIGALAPTPPAAARADLAARIEAIETRMHSLDVERPYPQLQNPKFELGAAERRMMGWQPRIGKSGTVEIAAVADPAASAKTNTDGRALHLRSEDGLGVAAQSYLFPIPQTGQLTVRARVRVADLAPDARMYVWIEGESSAAAPAARFLALGEGRLSGEWAAYDVEFDDLPLGVTGQMKVQFHLVGRGEAWVDDVELFDLRLPEGQRKQLPKRLLAAKAALDEGQLADCQRLVEGYWPRFLVTYLPASDSLPVGTTQPEVRIATRPEETSAAPEAGSPGIGDRMRGLFRYR